MDWFLYDNGLRLERVNHYLEQYIYCFKNIISAPLFFKIVLIKKVYAQIK